jgi:hypothetical protein
MDPLTEALALVGTIAKFYLLLAESATPAARADLATMWVEDMKFWREILHKLVPTSGGAGAP